MTGQKLKVVQVIPCLKMGGAERLVLDITAGLEKLGHEVFIILFKPDNHFPVLSKEKHIEIIPSQVSYSITGKDIIETKEFDRRLREIKPDIIHSHLIESEFVSRYNTVADTAYVTHWHGCHPPTNSHSFQDYLRKDAWWHLYSVHQLKRQYKICNNRFLCISDFIGKYVHRAFNPESKNLRVILNGSDLFQFSPSHSAKKNERFTLISVGSFHPYKNQLFLLKMLQQIIENRVKDIRILFLGDGVERENLEGYVRKNNLSNYVEFLGYVDEPSSYMNEADVLVHSAIDEPFGLILLEAMSCGLPVVAFNSGGIPEIVKHESTGFLTQINHIEDFAKSVVKIKDTPKLAEQFSQQAQLEVQRFGIEEYVKKIEAFYMETIQKEST